MTRSDTIAVVHVHKGTRYPDDRNKGRRGEPLDEDDQPPLSLAATQQKTKKSTDLYFERPPEAVQATIAAKRAIAKMNPVDAQKIRFVIRKKEYFRRFGSDLMLELINARKLEHPSIHDSLYAPLISCIDKQKFRAIERFYVVATGVDPERKKELGTFIKVRIMVWEFILPLSFLKDCRKSFLENAPGHLKWLTQRQSSRW